MNFGGGPMEELYTNQTHRYFRVPHIYLSLPMRFCAAGGLRVEIQDAAGKPIPGRRIRS